MANTTNLDLVKPAGTDKALVSVINANSDKIDAFAGTTNQAISNLTGQQFSSFSAIPLTFRGACIVTSGSGVDPNSPYPTSTVYWWNVLQIGIYSRLTQIATQTFDGNWGKDELWIRSRHRDDTDITQGWSNWKQFALKSHIVSGKKIISFTNNTASFTDANVKANADIIIQQNRQAISRAWYIASCTSDGTVNVYAKRFDNEAYTEANVPIQYIAVNP